jgi:hypothetical protein
LLNFFNLNTVDQIDFRTKANITIVENLKTSYLEEAQQTLIKYKTNKEFGYGEADTNMKYEDLFNLKRGDLIKLNFGIASQNNIDEYYKTNKNKLTRIYKKQGENLTEEDIFKYISSSSYWIVHKIKVNRKNKKIKSLELVSTVEGKTLSIPLTDEKG